MTVVIGTAGHIDHGKTTLLRALTGIDADRLPEERRRGMTIEVGYAHLAFGDGAVADFVDVPGHEKLVGNMLVGAGEIDAVLLVVAADDGPRAQTIEHLGLLDALGLTDAVVAQTKVDVVADDPDRLAERSRAIRVLVDRTSIVGSPIIAVSGVTGEGLDELRSELRSVVDRVATRTATERGHPARIAVDRVFTVKGRGTVVTGSLRGGPLSVGDSLDVRPGQGRLRIRELQVHNGRVERLDGGGRVAMNVVGPGVEKAVAEMLPGEVLLLENTRFEPGETKNDPTLATEFARLAELFVEDAFGSVPTTLALTRSTRGTRERLLSAASSRT